MHLSPAKPEIWNSDRDSHFTAADSLAPPKNQCLVISRRPRSGQRLAVERLLPSYLQSCLSKLPPRSVVLGCIILSCCAELLESRYCCSSPAFQSHKRKNGSGSCRKSKGNGISSMPLAIRPEN